LLYLLDFARLYPPECYIVTHSFFPYPDQRAVFHKMLRPELVAHNDAPLCSDAFTGFIKKDPKRKYHNNQVRLATENLIFHVIPAFAKFLHHSSRSDNSAFASLYKIYQANSGKAILSHSDENYVSAEDCGVTVNQLTAQLNQILTKMHTKGINRRWFGLVRHHIGKLTTTDPSSGILMKALLFTEMAARVCKNIVRFFLRQKMRQLQVPSSEPYRRVILALFNIFSGYSQYSHNFWTKNNLPFGRKSEKWKGGIEYYLTMTQRHYQAKKKKNPNLSESFLLDNLMPMKCCIIAKFGTCSLTEEELNSSTRGNPFIFQGVLFARLCDMLGIQLADTEIIFEELNGDPPPLVPMPYEFIEPNLLDLVAKTKHMHFIARTEGLALWQQSLPLIKEIEIGKTEKMNALEQLQYKRKIEKTLKLLKYAKIKLESALKSIPDSIGGLAQLAEVEYQLAMLGENIFSVAERKHYFHSSVRNTASAIEYLEKRKLNTVYERKIYKKIIQKGAAALCAWSILEPIKDKKTGEDKPCNVFLVEKAYLMMRKIVYLKKNYSVIRSWGFDVRRLLKLIRKQEKVGLLDLIQGLVKYHLLWEFEDVKIWNNNTLLPTNDRKTKKKKLVSEIKSISKKINASNTKSGSCDVTLSPPTINIQTDEKNEHTQNNNKTRVTKSSGKNKQKLDTPEKKKTNMNPHHKQQNTQEQNTNEKSPRKKTKEESAKTQNKDNKPTKNKAINQTKKDVEETHHLSTNTNKNNNPSKSPRKKMKEDIENAQKGTEKKIKGRSKSIVKKLAYRENESDSDVKLIENNSETEQKATIHSDEEEVQFDTGQQKSFFNAWANKIWKTEDTTDSSLSGSFPSFSDLPQEKIEDYLSEQVVIQNHNFKFLRSKGSTIGISKNCVCEDSIFYLEPCTTDPQRATSTSLGFVVGWRTISSEHVTNTKVVRIRSMASGKYLSMHKDNLVLSHPKDVKKPHKMEWTVIILDLEVRRKFAIQNYQGKWLQALKKTGCVFASSLSGSQRLKFSKADQVLHRAHIHSPIGSYLSSVGGVVMASSVIPCSSASTFLVKQVNSTDPSHSGKINTSHQHINNNTPTPTPFTGLDFNFSAGSAMKTAFSANPNLNPNPNNTMAGNNHNGTQIDGLQPTPEPERISISSNGGNFLCILENTRLLTFGKTESQWEKALSTEIEVKCPKKKTKQKAVQKTKKDKQEKENVKKEKPTPKKATQARKKKTSKKDTQPIELFTLSTTDNKGVVRYLAVGKDAIAQAVTLSELRHNNSEHKPEKLFSKKKFQARFTVHEGEEKQKEKQKQRMTYNWAIIPYNQKWHVKYLDLYCELEQLLGPSIKLEFEAIFGSPTSKIYQKSVW